jgi:hypothetical protein
MKKLLIMLVFGWGFTLASCDTRRTPDTIEGETTPQPGFGGQNQVPHHEERAADTLHLAEPHDHDHDHHNGHDHGTGATRQ